MLSTRISVLGHDSEEKLHLGLWFNESGKQCSKPHPFPLHFLHSPLLHLPSSSSSPLFSLLTTSLPNSLLHLDIATSLSKQSPFLLSLLCTLSLPLPSRPLQPLLPAWGANKLTCRATWEHQSIHQSINLSILVSYIPTPSPTKSLHSPSL